MKLHPMWESYPNLKKELYSTLKLMNTTVNLPNKEVEKAVLAMIHSGGKMLRPAYQLLFSQFGDQKEPKKTIALAAAIELLHTATLIHDDIVDEAITRRSLPTIKAQFGNHTAVYAGDYLFVCCFKLLSAYASSLNSIQSNVKSMEKVLSGELGQLNNRYDLQMTIEQYIENISGKTAELFALSCFVGSYESGTSEYFAKKCYAIGKNIGVAFQIVDDILDYSQSSNTLGKPVLEDVRQGVYSLPLLYALKTNKAELLPYLAKKEQITNKDITMIYQLVHSAQGVSSAQQLAQKYTKKALVEIQKLPDNASHTKQNLLSITKTILNRTN